MKLLINNEEFEVRVQKRSVTFCDVMFHGKPVSKGIAIENPNDPDLSEEIGQKIAINRALQGLMNSSAGPFNLKTKTNEIVTKLQKRAQKKYIQEFIDRMFTKSMEEFFKYDLAQGTGYFDGRASIKRYPGWADLDNRPKTQERNMIDMQPTAPPPRHRFQRLLDRFRQEGSNLT